MIDIETFKRQIQPAIDAYVKAERNLMIEDTKHMEVLDAFGRELQAMLVDYNARANGKTDKAEVCELRLEQNAALLELLTQQRRAIEHMLGKPIDPQTHFGEAIVIGAFGGNA